MTLLLGGGGHVTITSGGTRDHHFLGDTWPSLLGGHVTITSRGPTWPSFWGGGTRDYHLWGDTWPSLLGGHVTITSGGYVTMTSGGGRVTITSGGHVTPPPFWGSNAPPQWACTARGSNIAMLFIVHTVGAAILFLEHHSQRSPFAKCWRQQDVDVIILIHLCGHHKLITGDDIDWIYYCSQGSPFVNVDNIMLTSTR